MTTTILLALVACTPKSPVPPGSPPATDTDTDTDTDVEDTDTDPAPRTIRFATYNASLFRSRDGQLAEDLRDGTDPQARGAAAVLQELRPDVLLLNEFDHDADGLSAQRFRDGFLAVSQDGRDPLSYPYAWAPPVNTGIASGHDLDNDGTVADTPGTEAWGNDSFGFGVHPGQYGLLVLSTEPIATDAIRTFQHFPWKDVPDAKIPDDPETPAPDDWYTPEERAVLRLSSKTHADVPIDIGDTRVHLLVSHPTPPSFDGPDDHNGLRNHDEIRFWRDYVDGGPESWHVDDAGVRGALVDETFVVMGDLNNDPHDGDADGSVIAALIGHPRVRSLPTPTSPGGTEQAALQGGRNDTHTGDPAEDTADFSDGAVGNLKVDHVLPSSELDVLDAGVFWPLASDPLLALVEHVSDHRPVWIDVAF